MDADGLPGAVFVEHRLGRDLEEVLRVVFRHLVALGRYLLGEIAVTVEEAHRHEVHVHVTGLLEVVAGKDAEASGVYLEGSVEAVLHAEVAHRRFGPVRLLGHVGIEILHHCIQLRKEFPVLCERVVSLETDLVQDLHRVVSRLVPEVGVNRLEKRLCIIIPTPPEVLAEGLET